LGAFLFDKQRLFCKPASQAVALDAPAGYTRDQKSYDGSKDQGNLCLTDEQVTVRVAHDQQPLLFRLHLSNYNPILIRRWLVFRISTSEVQHRVDTLCPAQANDRLAEFDLLIGQAIQRRKLSLLIGIIRG
jgi:hypothetical protein